MAIDVHGDDGQTALAGAHEVTAWSVPKRFEATLLIAVQLLTVAGIDTEVRTEELRVIRADAKQVNQRLRQPTDVAAAKRAADTQLLKKLETLRYRASVLASGTDIDKLRDELSKVTVDDLVVLAAVLR